MKTSFLIVGILLSSQLFAQSYIEQGLMFSRTSVPGTARSVGTGNAFGSVGADLGSVGINPAGLGLYRSFDISLTPALSIVNNEAEFNGSFVNKKKVAPSLNQAGIVFTKLFKQNKGTEFTFNSNSLNSLSFAINYQRQSAFSRLQVFEGYNPYNSAMDVYAYYINSTGLPFNPQNYPVEMLLAFDSYMLDSANGNFFSTIPSKVGQSGQITKRGSIDQIDLALGGNVNDKFYFGAGVGINILTAFDDSYFDEYRLVDSTLGWNNYTLQTNLRTTGVGVNARFGFIYRPASFMRFGLAYHIPTFYSATETYSAVLTVDNDTNYYSQGAELSPTGYKFRSPMKGVASVSFYLKENGFFSVDYEFLNYGGMRYKFGDYPEFTTVVNDAIKKGNTFGHNVRAGFEGAYKTLRVRTGYNYSSTPYKKDNITKGYREDRHSASIGLGYRGTRFYADFGYVLGFTKDATYPYADFQIKNTVMSHNLLLTLGWKISKSNTPAKRVRRAPVESADRNF
ncbi:MAG TPA: hypothetical protein VK154_11615 [Chitinophagales bacterium]|nr:hypothetical protein [Chitinophagales bacterium]